MKPGPINLVSGPYSRYVGPWLDTELKRITGLSVDSRDVVRIFTVYNLSITCALAEEIIVFCLMREEIDRSEQMVAAIKMRRDQKDLDELNPLAQEATDEFKLWPWMEKALKTLWPTPPKP